MSSFTDPLTVTKLSNGRWKVERSFRYYIGDEGSNDFVDVPYGFETDFASVPRPFWAILPPDGTYSQAAVLHDWLYSIKGGDIEPPRDRKECDDIFLEAMGVLKVPGWKRYLMYYAVRSFGWVVF